MTQSSAQPDRAGRRRASLRTRLLALVLAFVAMALIAVDVVVPLTTKAALIAGKDRTLTSVVDTLPPIASLEQALEQVSRKNPLAGDIGWSEVTVGGVAKVLQAPAGHPSDNPAVGARPPVPPAAPITVADAGDSGASYRILGAARIRQSAGGPPVGYLVAWIPLSDVQSTIGRLVLLEVLISLGLLVLVGAAAGLVIRRELRPLETMALAADEIAAGDLSRRVDPGAPGTEVGRLGTAFNGMVDGVSDLLAERAESERRMRQFVADASHELRTPVAAIRGYTDLYRAGALPEEVALDRAMERMGFESRRMGALVEDLLTLTHTDAETAAPTERVDLATLLTGVVDDAAVIDRSRTWRLAGTATRAVVLGDRLRLHQLFANLLANVRTHTPAGTTATVSVTAVPGVPAAGRPARPGGVTVAVSDDGPGVAPEDLPRLFDRFFRADPSRSRDHGGSGLGLSIAAAIVRTHRGRIAATPTPGGGLTVTVALPAAPPDVAAVGSTPSGAAGPDGARPGGVGPGGARPDGARPDGARPDGARPEAAGPQGVPSPPPVGAPAATPTPPPTPPPVHDGRTAGVPPGSAPDAPVGMPGSAGPDR